MGGSWHYEGLDMDDWLGDNIKIYDNLGKIPDDVFLENRPEIDKLRDEDDIEGLKNYFE